MKKLIIKKIFNASIEQVWEAFTTADILQKWWSPAAMKSSHLSVNLEKGGRFLFCFKGADGKEFWGLGVYQKIIKPNYLSYLDTFADADGRPVAPAHYGMQGDEIEEALVEIELSEDKNSTQMIISMDNYYDDSMTENMTKGWNSMFDKLEKIFQK